jgi:hypothetical protein
MNILSPLVLFTAYGLLVAPVLAADAPPLTGCAAKRQEISTQIEQARTSGNIDQQAGLEKALSENIAHCTDASLLKAFENKVLDAKSEVSRRQKDLDKAVSKGDPDKINKRKDKLAEARQELKDAHTELEKVAPDED